MKRSPSRLVRGLCIAAVLLTVICRPGSADERSAREYQVKAAFLFHFTEYVDWPAEAFPRGDSPLLIAIVGHGDPFNGALDRAVRDKRVGGHPIVVAHYDGAASVGPCHILFVCDDQADAVDQIVQRAGGATLTVGDLDAFTDHGGLMRFFPEDGKVRFEVNMDGLRHSRLRISSKLLKLARIVHE